MRVLKKHSEDAKVGWVALWLLGVPLPIVLILYLLRGCFASGSRRTPLLDFRRVPVEAV